MFKLLRSRAKFFYWIIALTFILFTFVVWGAQCNQTPRQVSETRAVGKVNGEEITWQEYDTTQRNLMAQMRQGSQGRPVTANMRAQAMQNAWDQLVDAKIVNQAIDARGLQASDAEVLDMMKNNPPMEVLAQYRDQQGNVDMDAYLADLADPNRDWTQYEAYIRMLIPQRKLMDEVAGAAAPTEQELRDEFARRNGRATAEYMGALFSDIAMDDEPSETQLRAYYDGHQDEYQLPARVSVEIVAWGKEPSEADELEIKQLALDVRKEIQDGVTDFAAAAALYSEDSTAQNGGDLGTFDRNRMVAPFTEAAFTLPVGEISEPVRTQFGYHLIEVLEQTEADGQVTEVHARHILFKVEAGEETLNALYESAGAFVDEARDAGFAEAAADAALDVQRPDAVRQGMDLPGLRNTLQGTQYAFVAKPGDVSPVLENDQVYYVVHVLDHLPAGAQPLEDVRMQVVTQVKRELKADAARAKLSPAVGEVQMGADMEAAAAGHALTYAVTDTFTYSGNVIGVGFNTDFNAKARESAVGELVPEVETPRGVFALRVLWKSEFDEEGYARTRDMLASQLANSRQQEALQAWLEAQREAAVVEDNRSLTFR
ncbi:MAG TPA: peptidylprolyl isomerase [Candidatus Krumholzibacteria bacterium]|nr:peptidylprolyl isomerase [Candidatus Krumholzibacteria bacterium]HRX51660.1 peptidylprolyl isomerase [Candidatus Krumholzibacteria bacterium]